MTHLNRVSPAISLVQTDVNGILVTAEKVLTAWVEAAGKALYVADLAFAIAIGRSR